MGEGYFQMFNQRSNKVEVTDSQTEALDICLWLLEQHGVVIPIKWWKGFKDWAVEAESGRATVVCIFWVGRNPGNTYELAVVMKQVFTAGGFQTWLPVSVHGVALSQPTSRRFQKWEFGKDGSLSEETELIQIPILRA